MYKVIDGIRFEMTAEEVKLYEKDLEEFFKNQRKTDSERLSVLETENKELKAMIAKLSGQPFSEEVTPNA